MQRLEVSGVVRLIYKSLGVKGLKKEPERMWVGLIELRRDNNAGIL